MTLRSHQKGADYRRVALVICAHGVAGGPGSAAGHAEALARRAIFASVEACCLKGAPDLAAAIRHSNAPTTVVVPFLMSDGYTARTVLPKALEGFRDGGPKILVTRPVATNPALAELAAGRAAATCAERGWAAGACTVIVAAHGTPRTKASGEAAHAVAARIAERHEFRDARAAFLEEKPLLRDLAARSGDDRLVVVGLFADEGPHGREDVLAALARVGERAIYAGALGPDPAMADIILDTARAEVSS